MAAFIEKEMNVLARCILLSAFIVGPSKRLVIVLLGERADGNAQARVKVLNDFNPIVMQFYAAMRCEVVGIP